MTHPHTWSVTASWRAGRIIPPTPDRPAEGGTPEMRRLTARLSALGFVVLLSGCSTTVKVDATPSPEDYNDCFKTGTGSAVERCSRLRHRAR